MSIIKVLSKIFPLFALKNIQTNDHLWPVSYNSSHFHVPTWKMIPFLKVWQNIQINNLTFSKSLEMEVQTFCSTWNQFCNPRALDFNIGNIRCTKCIHLYLSKMAVLRCSLINSNWFHGRKIAKFSHCVICILKYLQFPLHFIVLLIIIIHGRYRLGSHNTNIGPYNTALPNTLLSPWRWLFRVPSLPYSLLDSIAALLLNDKKGQ